MTIELSKNKITHIIHISDIHVRRSTRFDEYNIVFKNLYRNLKEFKKIHNNSLIVITGYIVHNKSDLSPECILTTWDFLDTLSKIYPIVLICGNHDIVESNKNKIDSITAILKHRPLDNMY